MQVDVAILGAGAAGLFCAVEAARRGRRVVVIEHARRAGEKIRISGGGRCNFTNLSTAPERFLSQNPRFALSPLARFTPRDFVARLDAAGIGWHERTLGQLFCLGSAQDIVDLLLRDLAQAGGALWTGTAIGGVEAKGAGFSVATARGEVRAARVVVATGGLSIPKIGATGFGHDLARRLGLPVVPTRPALVPLTFGETDLAVMRPLAGIGLPARVGAGTGGRRAVFEEALLFTHRGLSGPAILQGSSYWREGEEVSVDLLPGGDAGAALRAARTAGGRMQAETALGLHLPARLADAVAGMAGIAGRRVADLGNRAIDGLARAVHGWVLRPAGSEGYRTAEVTLGGVDTRALDARTMEAKAVPGLHFVGEVVDVTGWLGGYNFQWAWSSGWVAGQAV